MRARSCRRWMFRSTCSVSGALLSALALCAVVLLALVAAVTRGVSDATRGLSRAMRRHSAAVAWRTDGAGLRRRLTAAGCVAALAAGRLLKSVSRALLRGGRRFLAATLELLRHPYSTPRPRLALCVAAQAVLAVSTAALALVEVESIALTAPLLSAAGLGVVFLAVRYLPEPGFLVLFGFSASLLSYLVAAGIAVTGAHPHDVQELVPFLAVVYALVTVPLAVRALLRISHRRPTH